MVSFKLKVILHLAKNYSKYRHEAPLNGDREMIVFGHKSVNKLTGRVQLTDLWVVTILTETGSLSKEQIQRGRGFNLRE